MKIKITESQYKLYLKEQNIVDVAKSLEVVMPTISPIPKSKTQAAKVIPKILNSEGIGTYDFSTDGSDVNLNLDIKKWLIEFDFINILLVYKRKLMVVGSSLKV